MGADSKLVIAFSDDVKRLEDLALLFPRAVVVGYRLNAVKRDELVS